MSGRRASASGDAYLSPTTHRSSPHWHRHGRRVSRRCAARAPRSRRQVGHHSWTRHRGYRRAVRGRRRRAVVVGRDGLLARRVRAAVVWVALHASLAGRRDRAGGRRGGIAGCGGRLGIGGLPDRLRPGDGGAVEWWPGLVVSRRSQRRVLAHGSADLVAQTGGPHSGCRCRHRGYHGRPEQ